ncbi:unnamed protein product [Darwinula stevensoni]|uniref:WD repeat-containing protein 44 n=1 Tax=Darwinula stevensoni TaxID=69355 RepID=A0A7R8X6I1_9CRUS|nr:unnamed protein product [Darwinula stevensoni]CAG0881302.1 unnamed protein product [Darwinula stevensoni]
MSSDVSPLSHGECGSVFLSPLKVTPSGKGIESLAQDQENSLDIRSAIQGQFVVKPQDEDSTRAEGPGQELSGVLVPGVGSASLSPQHSSSPSEDAYLSLEDTSKYYSFDSKQSSLDSKTSGSRDSKRSSLDSRRSKKEPLGVVSSSPSHSMSGKGSFDRDADIMKQLNMFVRTRTDSGRLLSDKEILEQVTVLNLDTGERVPLSVAEEKLPSCVNPLSLHIMRLTSEYIGNSSLDGDRESDTESVCTQKSSIGGDSTEGSGVKKRTLQLKRFLGRTVGKTVNKAKSMAQHHVGRHKDSDPMSDLPDDTAQGDTGQIVRMKASSSHKGPYDFDGLVYIQNLSGEHSLPIWTMKFSQCGRLLATAGQDRGIRIWVLKDAFSYFQDMRTRYNAEIKTSPTPSQESLQSQHSQEERRESGGSRGEEMRDDPTAPFMPQPFCIYKGHNADVLDVSWSKDDRYFLSGSLDGKLRLWYIPDKKVALWNEVEGTSKLITAASFCQVSSTKLLSHNYNVYNYVWALILHKFENGKIAVVGTYDGRCIFYNTEELKYFTQIHVRSTRGKNAKGRKISGIEPAPGEDKILVTSNDSRIRLYDLRDLSLSCKYKGCLNQSSQIRACFSHDGKYIISGSENQCFYVWKTHHDYAKFSSARRDRNDYWEGIKAHNAVVTVAAFAPHPETILRQMEREKARRDGAKVKAGDKSDHPQGYFLVTADFHGCIKVFMSTTKPKHSSLPASALA